VYEKESIFRKNLATETAGRQKLNVYLQCHSRLSGILPICSETQERFWTSQNDKNKELRQRPQGVKVMKFMLFPLLIILVLFGCASNKELQRTTGTETQQIPPITISEYMLGFGDELEISVFRHDEMTKKVRILPDGKIQYPLVGEIYAQGLSVSQLGDKLREGLLKYYVDPQVSVSITSLGSQKFFVLGEVKKPGVYQLDKPKTVIDGISEAEGFTLDAKPSYVLLIRGGPTNPKPTYQVLDIDKVFKEIDMTQNVALRQEDIIYVPASAYADVTRFFDRIWTIIPARIALIPIR
jgi:polysaccharide biosynthesis/export protein